MAAVTKGLENLQEAISTCEQLGASLADATDAEAVKAKTVVQETLMAFHDVSDKFFLKTMMSVPPTKACRVETAALASLVSEQKWDSLPGALEKLQKATKTLVTKAKMDGTTIT